MRQHYGARRISRTGSASSSEVIRAPSAKPMPWRSFGITFAGQ